ncbi:hypothetical protein JOF56_007169 [Kibdelosporangium banguiense]|uniref:TROVE domain-containing protein n=1 Tax=Kibdelosporangium banguiense TaxID=1365924 RepID=A0ABS4TS13_9PSEU|nr:hypothetical protein [Kibdelosporangium banguiense]MBP2326784.1 hypothetical protein [Kibdelosporangium banguiense]
MLEDRPIAHRISDLPPVGTDQELEEMDELVAETVSKIGYGDAFFAWPEAAARRFCELVRVNTGRDPEGTARFLRWMRAETPMRYPALVGVAAFVRERLAKGEHGLSRQLVDGVLQRADDPGHLLAYWLSTYGRIPKPVKRGVADAVVRLYDEEALWRYDSDARHIESPRFIGTSGGVRTRRPLRFRDVIALTHPVAADEKQAEVFRRARGRTPGPNGRAGRDKLRTLDRQGWDWLVSTMSVPGLLANLRLFDSVSIPFETAMTVAARIAQPGEGIRPMRYAAAWKAVTTDRWRPALAAGAARSLRQIPEIPGRTLVAISPDTAEGAAFGLSLAQRCASVEVQAVGGEPFDVQRGESPLHALIRWQAADRRPARDARYESLGKGDHDRVVYISRWVHEPGEADVDVPMYLWQTGDPRRQVRDEAPAGNKTVFYGICDASFDAIPIMEGAYR